MLGTPSTATIDTARPSSPRVSARLGDTRTQVAGAGGLLFVGMVIFQNLVRGGSAPANDATGQEVLTAYADHRAVTFMLVASFVLSGLGLAVFLGGAMRRMVQGSRPAWAYTGLVGAIAIIALFSVLVGCEEALSVVAHSAHPSIPAIEALFALHNSVFTVLFLAIAVAYVGLSRAGIGAGITPPAFAKVAPVGAAFLALGAVAGPALAAGEAMPIFALAGLGFVSWLVFVATTGLRLVRTADQAVAA